MAGNPVFALYDACNDRPAEVADLKARYRAEKVGDVEVKDRLTAAPNRFLDPVRERRAALEAQPGLAEELIVTGTARARREVAQTVAAMRRAMAPPCSPACAAAPCPAARGLPR